MVRIEKNSVFDYEMEKNALTTEPKFICDVFVGPESTNARKTNNQND